MCRSDLKRSLFFKFVQWIMVFFFISNPNQTELITFQFPVLKLTCWLNFWKRSQESSSHENIPLTLCYTRIISTLFGELKGLCVSTLYFDLTKAKRVMFAQIKNLTEKTSCSFLSQHYESRVLIVWFTVVRDVYCLVSKCQPLNKNKNTEPF